MWKWETENEAKGVVVIVHNMLEHTGRYAYVITMLRRNGYHVIMGDLPGQGQTSRTSKGQIERFEAYHEHVLEWVKIANEYKLPTFVLSVGMGSLIMLNILARVDVPIEGLITIAPMLAFKTDHKTRKKMLTANIGTISKDTRFNLGITPQMLTRNAEVIEETENDALMLQKVSYHWYKEVIETMKTTMSHIKDIAPMPLCIMYGTDDEITDTEAIETFKTKVRTQELYFKAWEGLKHEIHNEPERDEVMRYVLSFLNNRVHAMGLIIEDEIEEI